MKKVKFNNKSEYVDYCKNNDIYNKFEKQSQNYIDFEDGNKTEHYFNEKQYINVEPKLYPCVLVHEYFNDCNYGYFVYMNDF